MRRVLAVTRCGVTVVRAAGFYRTKTRTGPWINGLFQSSGLSRAEPDRVVDAVGRQAAQPSWESSEGHIARQPVSVEMARHGVTWSDLFAHWRLARAMRHRLRTTRMEPAA